MAASEDGDSAHGVARTISAWRPRGVPEEAAAFARDVVRAVGPCSSDRARALLFACSRLSAYGLGVGLEPTSEVLLRPSVIERFVGDGITYMPASRRRTLRTNLRYVGKRVAQNAFPPDPAPLSRSASKAPYSHAELSAYLALADAQPTRARKMALSGLVCLGAGAGIVGGDLKMVRGPDVRDDDAGGLVVTVSCRRPRVVPVLFDYVPRLKEVALFAGGGYVIGGRKPDRRNVTSGLISRISGGKDLPHIDQGRLRASWLVTVTRAIGLPELCSAAGITDSKVLFDLVAMLAPPSTDDVVGRLSLR